MLLEMKDVDGTTVPHDTVLNGDAFGMQPAHRNNYGDQLNTFQELSRTDKISSAATWCVMILREVRI